MRFLWRLNSLLLYSSHGLGSRLSVGGGVEVQIIGNVVKVNPLDQRGEGRPPVAVSIEGVSLLLPADHPAGLPSQGMMIKADVSTHWPRRNGGGSGRPVHWLQHWTRL